MAVVTGASSGIGAATVTALSRAGYRIVAGARRLERVKRVVGEAGVSLPLDVTDQESIDGFIAETSKRFGKVDVLVNNAGLALGLTPIAEGRDDEWVGMWDVNVLGLLRVTRGFLPLLRGRRTRTSSTSVRSPALRSTRVAPVIPRPSTRCAPSRARCASS